MILHLDNRWSERLAQLPERSMGAQHVDFILTAGRLIKNVVVFNCEECHSAEAFDPKEIVDVRLNEE